MCVGSTHKETPARSRLPVSPSVSPLEPGPQRPRTRPLWGGDGSRKPSRRGRAVHGQRGAKRTPKAAPPSITWSGGRIASLHGGPSRAPARQGSPPVLLRPRLSGRRTPSQLPTRGARAAARPGPGSAQAPPAAGTNAAKADGPQEKPLSLSLCRQQAAGMGRGPSQGGGARVTAPLASEAWPARSTRACLLFYYLFIY